MSDKPVRRVVLRPITTEVPTGWRATYPCLEATGEGSTEVDAIQALVAAHRRLRISDEAYRVRFQELMADPPPEWEPQLIAKEAYEARVDDLLRDE